MPADLIVELRNVLGGSLALGLFFATVWQLWRFQRPAGALQRGLTLRTEAVDPPLLSDLRKASGTERHPWGWTRREGDILLVFVDPTYSGDGDLSLRTFWPHVAEVHLDTATMVYRSPTLAMVVLGPLFLGVGPLLTHRALVARLRTRVARVAEEHAHLAE